MHAREALSNRPFFGEDIKKIIPGRQSARPATRACSITTLELLVLTGRPIAHAMMMMIPEPWSNKRVDGRRPPGLLPVSFVPYGALGRSASIAFTDGKQIGAILDRNGLRPSRYYVTKDGRVIMASEAGVLLVPPENIVQKGRPPAGPHVPCDTEEGALSTTRRSSEILDGAAVRQWLNEPHGPPERHPRGP